MKKILEILCVFLDFCNYIAAVFKLFQFGLGIEDTFLSKEIIYIEIRVEFYFELLLYQQETRLGHWHSRRCVLGLKKH